MIYLILDTNIWVYLANGLDTATSKYQESRHFELLARLKELVRRREIHVVVNSIVVTEWHRNKAHAYEQVKRLKKKAVELLQVQKRKGKERDFAAVAEIGQSIRAVREKIEQNEQHIAEVEDFLHNYCIEVPVTDELKARVFDLSISNKAPFHNKKNNTADAAILLSAAEYLKDILKDFETSAFFVSNNMVDFTNNIEKDKFHPDILDILPTREITYNTYLPDALKIGKAILEDIREFYRLQSVSFPCGSIVCSGQEDFERFGYLEGNTKWEYESDSEHPTQLDLFTGTLKPRKDRGTVKSGRCNFCGTLHVNCPRCGELVCAEQEADFQCGECEAKFEYVYSEETDESTLILKDVEDKPQEDEVFSDS